MWRNAPGHESCDYVDEGPDTYVAADPKTMDGRRPIASRPRAWIVPYRPVCCTDVADANFYCPHCDWNDYYCLCAALKAVGTDRDADGTRYGRLVERRRRETSVFRVGDRESVSVAPVEKETEKEAAADDDVGAKAATGAARPVGRVGPIAVEGRAVAVDEGGELSTGQAMDGAIEMAEASASGAADRSDAGGSGAGRSGDVLLKIPIYGRALTEEELLDWATAKEEGDVKVCCSWTAAPPEEDAKNASRRCCVWMRRANKRPASPTLTMRAGAEFDDDWEHECDLECDDDDRCPLVARETWKEREALLLAGRAEALRKQWRTEIPPGILYSTRRYEETMRLAFDRCGRALRQPADLKWVERAQWAIDVESIEEEIAAAEKELEERRRLLREREEAVRAWDADPVELDVVRETRSRRKRRIAQETERLREDETLHEELVLRRPDGRWACDCPTTTTTKKAKKPRKKTWKKKGLKF